MVEIHHGRTLVGSSPRSTIRLKEKGIEPVHCLIDADAGRLRVRRWAAGAFLNGEPFDDASLDSGDVLTIGPIDLVLVDPLEGDAAELSTPLTQLHNVPSADHREDELAGEAMVPKNQSARDVGLPVREVVLRDAVTLDQWECLARENTRLAGDIDQLADTQSRIINEISALTSELTSLQNQWSEWWQSQSTQWQAQLAVHDERVGELESQLVAVQQRLDAEQGKPASAEVDPTLGLDAREHGKVNVPGSASGRPEPVEPCHPDVCTAETEPDSASPRATDERATDQWQSAVPMEAADTHRLEPSTGAQGGLGTKLADEARPAQVDAPNADEVAAAGASTGNADDTGAAPSDGRSPVSYIERYAHLFSDDPSAHDQALADPSASLAGNVTRQADALSQATTPDVVPNAVSNDEESIEDYMAKLLQRVRGSSVQQTDVETPASLAAGPAGALQSTVNAHAGLPDPPLGAASDASDGPLVYGQALQPERAPLERASDLEVLRELANETARGAIRVHATQTQRRAMVTKLIVALLAGTTSVWLMLDAPHAGDLQFLSACVTLMAAAYWAGQAYGTLKESIRAQSYDGPDYEDGDLAGPFHLPLPIDFDSARDG